MERRDFIRLALSGFAGLTVADRIAGERLLAQDAILKVSAPGSMITDTVAINHLKRNGMAEKTVLDYVEFLEDYKAQKGHVSTKVYHNRLTDQRTIVSSGLPMVAPDGSKLIPGFERGAGHWYITNNLMTGEVRDDGQITVAPVCDQPTGRLKGQESSWKPVLYVGGIEMPIIGSPAILATDPFNGNYHNNVIEFDYGVCKRRVRIIEGRLHERWVFNANPGGEALLVHNATGWPLKLGQYAIDKDTERVTAEQLGLATYPLLVAASDTFYPDVSTGSTTVDGTVGRYDQTETWAQIRAGAGTKVFDNLTIAVEHTQFEANDATWKGLYRGIYLFDTSALPDGASISAATYSNYGEGSARDVIGISANCKVNVVASNPATSNDLVAADFTTLGTTLFATAIAYGSYNQDGYNDWALNASGIAAISDTGLTKLGLREEYYDILGNTPAIGSRGITGVRMYESDKGDGYKPKLVVTYSGGTATGPASVAGVASPSSVSGVASPTKVSGVD
jgi:hypothetical protein